MTGDSHAKTKGRPHLRLIPGKGTDATTSGEVILGPRQLSLRFPDSLAFFFVCVASMDIDEFFSVIDRCRSSWIIDVRAVPRFDIITTSRRSAFKLFQMTDATYIDLFGRLGIQSYRSEESDPTKWGMAIRDLLKEAKRKGPYVFLFDNQELLRDAHRVLPDMLRSIVGPKAHFSSISSTE